MLHLVFGVLSVLGVSMVNAEDPSWSSPAGWCNMKLSFGMLKVMCFDVDVLGFLKKF